MTTYSEALASNDVQSLPMGPNGKATVAHLMATGKSFEDAVIYLEQMARDHPEYQKLRRGGPRTPDDD